MGTRVAVVYIIGFSRHRLKDLPDPPFLLGGLIVRCDSRTWEPGDSALLCEGNLVRDIDFNIGQVGTEFSLVFFSIR